MNTIDSVVTFLNGIESDFPSEKKEFIGFLKMALIDFSKEESVTNAESVYSYFTGIYRPKDARGGPLTDMMDVMHTYETNASTLTEKQRDHYIHSVNVFILGLCLYQSNSKVRGAFTDVYGKGSFSTPEQCFLFMWGITSLFHDIGYPLEIASNQAKRFIRTISGINCEGRKTDIGLTIDPISDILSIDTSAWSGGMENALDLLAEGITRTLGDRDGRIDELVHGYPDKMFKDRYVDHGFFSSIILLRSYASSLQKMGVDKDRFYNEVVTAASAILLHNMYPYNLANDDRFGQLSIRNHPLGYMIMFSDILQEWNRKGYGIRNAGSQYPENSGIYIDEDMFRINYVINYGRIAADFGETKKKEMETSIEIDTVFPEGLFITSSCDRSADLLEEELRIFEPENVPRPLLESIVEIAKAIHSDYNENRKREKPDQPLEYPDWESLPQDLRYSNMSQALSISDKLEAIGCHIGVEGKAVRGFTDDEVERMSIIEHDRWVNERTTNGWVYGKVKDVDRRMSPYIAPWEDIPENIKEYDREPVRNMISILDRVGMKVIRD